MTAPCLRIVSPDDLPELEAQAAAIGRVLDYWPLFDGCSDLLATRFVATVKDRDEARACRYLGLTPP